ncbi:hypothetical protein SAMN05421780_101121 [Flexibacter flexilis DSM 6793]|uniref:Uncharacterized protein n=1 Tax=Flexibacter flexilis DSM 6793 TaxID=927664 RepID=A0A1I1DCE3_9BACT|nr:hypothetical protein [Flexibacter flexilis]SFB72581.1 hypothetical protein SAMN05421780_101121 [Flexibacter flexilis DSM 6793]
MKKSELSTAQISQIEMIYSLMKKAGWNGRISNDLFFNKEFYFPHEAVFDYHNRESNLVFMFSSSKAKVDITISDKFGYLNFVVSVDGCFEKLYEILTKFQNALSCTNYMDFIREVILNFPDKTFIYENDELKILKLNKNG